MTIASQAVNVPKVIVMETDPSAANADEKSHIEQRKSILSRECNIQ